MCVEHTCHTGSGLDRSGYWQKRQKMKIRARPHTGIVKTTIAAMSPHLVASGSSNHIMFLSYPLHILSILRQRIVEPVQRRSIEKVK